MSEIALPFAKEYGFDAVASTEYHKKGDSYTGEVTVRAANKHIAIKHIVEEHNLTLDDSYAIGDSMGDSTMLELVDNPIAFNPEKRLFEHAQEKGWKVVVERKNISYELELDGDEYRLVTTN
jgi:phosphoserine phosphatase